MKGISLFLGCGGDTLGMTNADIEVIGYSELKKKFCDTHDANFGACHKIGMDITKISDDELKKYEGKADIIFAGFPCQGFSHGGKKDPTDPRSQMYLQFSRAMRIIKPKYIIGENVKGLLTRKTPDGGNFFDTIIDEFKDAGYTCTHRVFRAVEVGVPQKRDRLIILGKRGDTAPTIQEPPEMNGTPNLTNIIEFTMEGALKVSPETFDGIPDDCILTDMNNTDDESNPHPYIIRQRDTDLGFSFGKRISPVHAEIIDIRNPAKTIICTYDHQPRLLVPLKNANGCYLRTMTPKELKQIQGFPANYTLCGSTKEQIVQLGNAVPPAIVTWVCQGLN
jgi:DNA (cytosine-5)-methyltransferase 1